MIVGKDIPCLLTVCLIFSLSLPLYLVMAWVGATDHDPTFAADELALAAAWFDAGFVFHTSKSVNLNSIILVNSRNQISQIAPISFPIRLLFFYFLWRIG